MKPVVFEHANAVLGLEGCDDLPVCRSNTQDGVPVVVSCFELSEEEIADIVKTGKMYLTVYGGHSQPPVALATRSPLREVS